MKEKQILFQGKLGSLRELANSEMIGKIPRECDDKGYLNIIENELMF